MESEIEKCLLRNTRAAARVMTRRFAEHMREFNVSTEQFSLLASLVGTDHNSVSALAEFLAIERTTLTRNLALLEKKQLVKLVPARKGNARTVELTPAGRQLMVDMTPAWRQAQSMAFKQVSKDEVDQALDVLRRITAELTRSEKF
ncbi:MarR family winged helix-turn-helix transcriptional regulator [Maritalea porphyrae]|uniref:MarR family winged helix-turn-helix transcriptional regulator n=1 Tax=Maritalea porphyrae TaxID=880732 RepID=UPI0022B03149|nr:MarR family winged helix-turn-helix transcriptional regulator [Maritalea porphyrae]MCZ4272730.1 MarR family winged helix-turn-helix transcriptional regulator [Maritalea porphyrae]